MEIRRDIYLNKLISKKHNGLIKVVTGMRRCEKSYLLFNLFGDFPQFPGGNQNSDSKSSNQQAGNKSDNQADNQDSNSSAQ